MPGQRPVNRWVPGRRSLDVMLRLPDARTGSYVEVVPARPGLLRVCAQVPSGAPGITGLRVLLVTDLLFRAAELANLQVLYLLASDGGSGGELAEMEQVAASLGIHPPTARAGSADASTAFGGPADVHVTSYGSPLEATHDGFVTAVGAARIAGIDGCSPAGSLPTGMASDPLTVRLALMSFPATEPAELTGDALARAGEAIASWRKRVAEWAQQPSKPVPAHLVQAFQGAFSDLDTVRMLATLDELASDDAVPAGARFEAFLYADRVLGLELPRDIGRLAG